MNIVVTGASRGIGYELVKLLSRDQQHLIFAVSRNEKQLEALKKECPNNNVVSITCDLSKELSIVSLLYNLKKHAKSIDILVNNAGAIINKPFSEISKSELDYIYNVNVFSVIRLIQGILPMLEEKQRSHVVNISSIGGVQGTAKFAGLSAYSSSKAALVCLTECLAEEFKDRNIAFNCLALGAVQTEMLNEAFPGYKAPLSAAEMASYIADFVVNVQKVMNGKIIPVSLSSP